MSKICRTCLRKSHQTFKTSQSLGNFEGDTLRISVVLRFCIPELYLGLSSNPEICVTCKENLKVAYLFKKRCLNTEHLIGNFLKDARCTAKSVELHDVLEYFNDELKNQENDGHLNTTMTLDSNTIVDLGDPKEALNNVMTQQAYNNENSQVLDAQQPVPCPTNTVNYSKSQNVIVNQFELLLPTVQKPINENGNSVSNQLPEKAVTREEFNDIFQETDSSNSMFKISSVFSLNGNLEYDNINCFNSERINTNEGQSTAETIDIKDEPLDNDIDARIDLNCSPTDEDTLSASEIASFENCCSTPSIQQFIANIGLNNSDQYVDVPDFVTINNFGFKELEELRLQHKINEKVNVENEALPMNSNSVLSEGEVSSPLVEGNKPETNIVKVLSNGPDVIMLNGRRMIKCGESYKIAPDESAIVKESEMQEVAIEDPENSISSSLRKRNRRRIKMVPVSEQPVEKKFKGNESSAIGLKLPKADDKDVVVLFTNYTADGIYINDHDYLISPYKRNKVLIEEKDSWLCMCYICNMKHHVHNHVEHMKTHGSWCCVCSSDLGTPYMHNIHFRSHKKPCKYCTQVLPYGQIREHEEKHIEEEKMRDLLNTRVYSPRRGKRKLKKDEKPVYFAIPKLTTNNLKKADIQSDGSAKTVCIRKIENYGIESLETIKPPDKEKTTTTNEENEVGTNEIVERHRTLRARVKKMYAESDDDDIKEGDSTFSCISNRKDGEK